MGNNKLNSYINRFIEVVSQDKGIDLSTFYSNLDSLNIELVDENNKYGHPAWYNGDKNTIYFSSEDIIDNSIYHELFHCASTKITEGYIYCGFEVVNYKTHGFNGRGLNEGYTELLNERLFGNSNAYWLQKFYITKLEEIIDPEFIKKCYFDSNVDDLQDELCKYSSKEDIIKFVYYLDFYTCFQLPNFKKLGDDIEKVQEGITFCSDFLLKCYSKKIANEDSNNLSKIQQFINSFQKKITDKSNDNVYKLHTSITAISDSFDILGIDAELTQNNNDLMIKIK